MLCLQGLENKDLFDTQIALDEWSIMRCTFFEDNFINNVLDHVSSIFLNEVNVFECMVHPKKFMVESTNCVPQNM